MGREECPTERSDCGHAKALLTTCDGDMLQGTWKNGHACLRGVGEPFVATDALNLQPGAIGERPSGIRTMSGSLSPDGCLDQVASPV